jgi:co-chaperonin GroES (HSP10)
MELTTQFPVQPLFDRVIVREIPIAEFYEQSETGVVVDLDNSNIKERSDRGEVIAVGEEVTNVKPGQVVQFNEICLYDPIYLNPAHKNRHDLPKYWQIRVQDLNGIRLPSTVKDSEKRAVRYTRAGVEISPEEYAAEMSAQVVNA